MLVFDIVFIQKVDDILLLYPFANVGQTEFQAIILNKFISNDILNIRSIFLISFLLHRLGSNLAQEGKVKIDSKIVIKKKTTIITFLKKVVP